MTEQKWNLSDGNQFRRVTMWYKDGKQIERFYVKVSRSGSFERMTLSLLEIKHMTLCFGLDTWNFSNGRRRLQLTKTENSVYICLQRYEKDEQWHKSEITLSDKEFQLFCNCFEEIGSNFNKTNVISATS